eukprot:g50305.t1
MCHEFFRALFTMFDLVQPSTPQKLQIYIHRGVFALWVCIAVKSSTVRVTICFLSYRVQTHWLPTKPLATSPHLLYAVVWTNANAYQLAVRSMTSCDAMDVFARVAGALKVLQLASVFLYVWDAGVAVDPLQAGAVRWFLGLACFVVGQLFNLATYKALGRAGVYYGTRLGHNIPWVKGFPFSVLSHPQYKGSALSIWGVAVILAPAAGLPEFYLVAIFGTMLYGISAYIEFSPFKISHEVFQTRWMCPWRHVVSTVYQDCRLHLPSEKVGDDALEALSHLVNLRHLRLGNCSSVTANGVQHLSKLINLRSLDLRNAPRLVEACITLLAQGLATHDPASNPVATRTIPAKAWKARLDHEINLPAEEQPAWRWQPPSPSSEEEFMDYLEHECSDN